MPRDEPSCIRSVVRVRPLVPHELTHGDVACCEIQDATTIHVNVGAGWSKPVWRQYTFDACLSPECSQKQVFQNCGVTSLLEQALQGFSATILAYGQTGSGKTHTMVGCASANPRHAEEGKLDDALVMRSAKRLFRRIAAEPPEKVRFSVSASFSEVYNSPGSVNECVCDLLNPASRNLQVRFNQKNGFFVEGLRHVDCMRVGDVHAALLAGLENRRVGAHAINKDSSRSHAFVYSSHRFRSRGI